MPPDAGGADRVAPLLGGVAGVIGAAPLPGWVTPDWSGALAGRCSKSQALKARAQTAAAKIFVFMAGFLFVSRTFIEQSGCPLCITEQAVPGKLL